MTTTPPVPAHTSATDTSASSGPTATTVLGYPRLGRHRELKRVLEDHWAGRVDADRVRDVARELRATTWDRLVALGVDRVPSNVASLYDHVLDAAVLVDAVPERFRHLADVDEDRMALRFGMARGTDELPPLELTKWFDTNYHYLVPEIDATTPFRLADDQPLREVAEGRARSLDTRPVLIGPATFLLLAKAADGAPEGFRPFDRLDDLVPVYAQLLAALAEQGVSAVQLDEPILVTDLDGATRETIGAAYRQLTAIERRPDLLVATYFGDATDHLGAIVDAGVEAVAVDLTATDPSSLAAVPGIDQTTVVAGVVDGRNVWRTDPDVALERLRAVRDVAARVVVAPSCSLLHVPHDVEDEIDLDPRLRSWLAFADQKVAEVVALALSLDDQFHGGALDASRRAVADRAAADWTRDESVRRRLDTLDDAATRRVDPQQRRDAQADLGLPPLPTTTIGSFPQTAEVRKARAAHRNGELDDDAYRRTMHDEIARVIALQEELGLDVLVHGEPERNDMVQYFAEELDGFVTTRAGWVQSYGTRAVRPPILYGDVHRPAPITIPWFTAAQARTERPVKGMLTGPVTILAWSFVRDDQPLADTAAQIALAIRDEVADLEQAGARVVQVDEPALRELLPLRAADRPDYLDWSVRAFRLATAGAAESTQIHTHLCYSEFGDVIDAIHALDADVTSVEAARSRMEVVDELAAIGFDRGVGPGVYDIHSPRVPSVEELVALLRTAAAGVPSDRLWVNPDCGLKTRGYAEVEPALRNLVAAASQVRAELGSSSG